MVRAFGRTLGRSAWLLAALALAGTLFVLLAPGAQAFGYPHTFSTGNDGGKYIYISSDDPYQAHPVYNFQDISGTGTAVTMGAGGYMVASTATVPTPFPFTFYGQKPASYWICSGGMIVFAQGSYQACPTYYYQAPYYEWPSNVCCTMSYAIGVEAGPLWYNPGAGSAIYHATLGTSPNRIDIVQWQAMQFCTKDSQTTSPGKCTAGAGKLTFQVQMFEKDNHIEMHYKESDMTGVPSSEAYTTNMQYGYGLTQIGILGEGNYCYSSCTKGISYRMSCDTTYVWFPCYQANQPSSYWGYCYSTCTTFAPPAGFAITYYKNSDPQGGAITGTTDEDTPIDLPIQGYDPDGRPLFGSLNGASLVVTAPQHGSVTPVNPGSTGNGFFRYTPAANYNGPDSFTFRVSDGAAKDPSIYTALVTVRPVDDFPVGAADTIQVWDPPHQSDIPAPGVLANDVDVEVRDREGPNGSCFGGAPVVQTPCLPPNQSTYVDVPSTVGPAQLGSTGSFTLRTDGSFSYRAKDGYFGPDSFKYKPCDDNDVSTKQPTKPVTTPPSRLCDTKLTTTTLDMRRYSLRAEPDEYTLLEDGPLTTTARSGLLVNDPGGPNATKVVLATSTLTHGSLSVQPTGAFTYTPFANACDSPGGKPDVASYYLSNATNEKGNTVTATFYVLCVDDAPVWSANSTALRLPLNSKYSDRFFATNPLVKRSLCCSGGYVVQLPTSVLQGPCTTYANTRNECALQGMHFETTTDNPALFAAAGQPTVSLHVDREFTKPPYSAFSGFTPVYGWLNLTLEKEASGHATITACLVDDGIATATADAPGSIARTCKTLDVLVPGPPITAGEHYNAYVGHDLATDARTGVLANDRNWTLVGQPAANLKALLFAAPSHVIAFEMRPDGGFTLTPETGYVGHDYFMYTATDGTYTSAPQRVEMDVLDAAPPGAAFRWTPDIPGVGETVLLLDQSDVPDAAIVAWSWDLGDGSSANEQYPSHAFQSPGEYVVRLTVRDSKGDLASTTNTIRVNSATAAGTLTLDPAGGRGAPKAYAGADMAVGEGDTVQLAGSATPASVASFSWRQTSGPPVVLDGRLSPTPRFVAPRLVSGQAEALVFQLTVFDGAALSAPSNLTVLVQSQDHAPTVDAGGDQVVQAGTSVRLDGSRTRDDEGQTVTLHWEQVEGPAVVLAGAAQPVATFTAPAVATGLTGYDLAFELHANDGRHADSVDRVQVHVQRTPVAQAFSFQAAAGEPELVAFHGGSPAAVWDFGDGGQATGPDPLHRFPGPGHFFVTLTVDGAAHTTEVVVAPQALAAANAQRGTPLGLAVALTAVVAALAMVLAARRRA